MDNAPAPQAKWPPYPAYKPSGVEWLGDIPAHWNARKLKYVASVEFSSVDKHTVDGERPVRLCNYLDVYSNDFISDDIEFMAATASPDEVSRFSLRRGDILVTKDSESWDDIAVAAYVDTDLDGVLCGYHLARVKAFPQRMHAPYLFRAFGARGINDQFRVAATGVTRYGLGKYSLAGGRFPVPPLEEQCAVAAFLDRETARIDALIAKKQEQIALLQEKRSALISHTVTRGLDPTAPVKDSGIEWLGQIPEHWDLVPLRRVAQLQTGLTLGKRHGARQLVLRPYLRVANVQDGYLDLQTITEVEVPPEEVHRYELRPGDVLMTEGGDYDKLGRGYVWDGDIGGCLHQNHVFAVRPDQAALRPLYLAALTASSHGRAYFTSTAHQTTNLASTNSFKIRALPVPLPPLQEQDDTLARIAHETFCIDVLAARVHDSCGSLRELRTALISAAVTGKIDVRREVV